MIIIVSVKHDLHALAIARSLQKMGAECGIIESDALAQSECLEWSLTRADCVSTIRDHSGLRRDITRASVVWLRRLSAVQVLEKNIDAVGALIVNHDSAGALKGALFSACSGKFVSPYHALLRGSDKLFQLKVAASCGWRVPDTLVTQSKASVLEFAKRHEASGIVVKSIVGAPGAFLFTRKIHDASALNAAEIEACPAIYQECIEGDTHVRLVKFGEQCMAALVTSDDLDWRGDIAGKLSPWDVPADVNRAVQSVLSALGLEMGVIDIKITPAGELVWFEVNPQGQFLFLEPLTGLPLERTFSEYLYELDNAQ
jgi:glutathione synthase/RimK-type ligase-like ATP-grasp enzyme